MNAMSNREAKKRTYRCDSQNAHRNMTEFYREARPGFSSDTESSDLISDCNESDYLTSYDEPPNYCPNPRDEQIAKKLSKLELGCGQDDSIVARSPRADDTVQTIASIADSRISCIFAGQLNEGEAATDEQSLLNIAINESEEKYEDSLDEVCRVSRSSKVARDSLEPQAFARIGNAENLDPNIQGNGARRIGRLPKIVSDEIVSIPIRMVDKRLEIENVGAVCSKSILRDNNDNIREVSKASVDKYDSLVCEKERLITADIKTPHSREIKFIEDCCKSSPKVGVNADTFGSEFISDISELSMLGEIEKDPETRRKKILKRFSQQFIEAPTLFTEKLLTLFEESFLPNSKVENSNVSDVDLSRLTAEFRKICRDYGKGIEDESMPDCTLAPSFLLSTPPAPNQVLNLQNFSKLGGGKKVYRKTPRRVFAGTGNQCGTPNCGNALHRGTGDLNSPRFRSNSACNDSTASFEFWENLYYQESPTKRSLTKLTGPENSERVLLSLEEFLRRSDEQMASLDQSLGDGSKAGKESLPIGQENFSITSSKECQDNSYSTRKKFIDNLSPSLKNEADKSLDENVADFNCKQKYFEVENSLAARLVEKRRRCFEEARKVFEAKENALVEKNAEPSKKASEFTGTADSLKYDNFVSTLAACVDYIDHARTLQNHRNSLNCILECSEGPELVTESPDDSLSVRYFETLVIPAVNLVEVRKKRTVAVAAPKTPRLISQASLYLPGSPGFPSSSKLAPKSPGGCSRRSAGRKLSPSGHAPSVIAKKIRSPVSPVRIKNTRAVKPASHTVTPQSPCRTLTSTLSEGSRKNWSKPSPNVQSSTRNRLKSAGSSPGLMDVTNLKKRNVVPKLVVTNSSPFTVSQKQCRDFEVVNTECQRQLHFSESQTPEETARKNKFFFTPDKTPTYGKVRPKKKYFNTPRQTPLSNKMPAISPSLPGSHRINYNIVQSPVGNYIRGTEPNLITNVRGKTNERMLTPRSKATGSARSKVISPILSRSPRLSPTASETSRLKFQLNPQRRQNQNQECDILNIALCESDRSSNVGSDSTSHSPFPKIFYKPAPSVKMVKDDLPKRRVPKTLAQGIEEKIVYRHEGRLKSATQQKALRSPVDTSTKDSLTSCDSGDISLLHQRPAAKTNYLLKK